MQQFILIRYLILKMLPTPFLGLTKDKSPDELDKIDEELRQEYLKNKNSN